MSITMRKVEVWETSDGVRHTTKEMAEHHIINWEMINLFGDFSHYDHAQDVLNLISDNREAFRRYLDACDALERAILK